MQTIELLLSVVIMFIIGWFLMRKLDTFLERISSEKESENEYNRKLNTKAENSRFTHRETSEWK